jgi:uncharacterized Ntn-hydrolase superfamily protein
VTFSIVARDPETGGDGFSCQGNILVSGATVEAMAAMRERTGLEFAERLVAAIQAGQAAGGDAAVSSRPRLGQTAW